MLSAMRRPPLKQIFGAWSTWASPDASGASISASFELGTSGSRHRAEHLAGLLAELQRPTLFCGTKAAPTSPPNTRPSGHRGNSRDKPRRVTKGRLDLRLP